MCHTDPTRGRRRRRVTGGSESRDSQLKVPGSVDIIGPAGMPMPPAGIPSSQQGAVPMLGPMAGPQGSQTGPQGAPIGMAAGAARPPQGERNSMNDGRRQLLPPKQLLQVLQPGAAARADRAIARHTNRDMTDSSRWPRRRHGGRGVSNEHDRRRLERRHPNPSSRFAARSGQLTGRGRRRRLSSGAW